MAVSYTHLFGSYKVLTVGSLSDRFRLSDNAGNKLAPGTTTLQQVIVSLKRETDVVNFEFQHLYFGEVVEVDHLPSSTDHKIYPVNLIRDTNRFNLALIDVYKRQDIDIPEFKEIPTYKRMCVCILKNDHACKYMGFSPTKEEMSKRSQIMEQYRIIVSCV